MGISAVKRPASSAEAKFATEEERIAFWEEQARRLHWSSEWHTAHTFEPARPQPDGELSVPRIEWFAGGTLNAAYNCVDRHVAAGLGDKPALFFEGEPGDRRTVTYAELQDEVCRAANALTALGIGKGDRVVIYLPVLVETVVVTLACARIGAVHSLVFGGFSAEALRFRVEDTGRSCSSPPTDSTGRAVPVKANADAAVAGVESIEHVLVIRRTGSDIEWTPERDVWWHDSVDTASPHHQGRGVRRRDAAVHHVHLGHHGEAEGPCAHLGGYLTQASWSFEHLSAIPTRHCAPRTSTGARPTSPGSLPTPTRSTARSRTAPRR